MNWENQIGIFRAIAWVSLGLPTIFALSRWTNRFFSRKMSPQHGLIIEKAVFLTGLFLVVASVFQELEFDLTPLLGAAGVVGIAFGVASQTSLSNLISGLFLITERHFRVGDVVTIGELTGQVLSIDLLSVKIRTFDNKFIRIPNESIIKSQVSNITHFPIRRIDLTVGVAYKEDIGRVREVLMDIAHKNPACLMEPEPLIIFNGFGQSSIDLLFLVWAAREDWLTVKNTIMEEIKARFDKEKIEFPFPHMSLYAGSATQPFPVRVVNQEENLTAAHVKE